MSAAPDTSRLVPVGPIRVADTRAADCGCTRLDTQNFTVDVAGHPDVPDDAVAVAVTLTAPPNGEFGHVTAYPGGTTLPTTSNLNTRPWSVVANSAIVRLGADGDLAVWSAHPLEAGARLLAVYVDGRRVYRRPASGGAQ